MGRCDAEVEHAQAAECRGDYAAAARAYQRAVEAEPGNADAWNRMGRLFMSLKRPEAAERAFRQVVRLLPDNPAVLRNLGTAQAAGNRHWVAASTLDRAVALEPGSIANRWAALRVFPVVYADDAEVEAYYQRYRQRLQQIRERLVLDTPAQIHDALQFRDAFLLHYQRRCHRELQQLHGQLVHRIARAAHPQWSVRPALPSRCADGRIRVGFASWAFRRHTVSKLFKGWIAQLDRQRFAVHVYHLGSVSDQMTESLRQAGDVFHHFPMDREQAGRQIVADRLHVLIYPELGMDTKLLCLAGCWLAPVQCMAWGHPISSGLPTIEYFLSSELMEPADGDDH